MLYVLDLRILAYAHTMMKSKSQGIRARSVNEQYFKVIDTPDKAYWLGFLCADGHITPDESKTVLTSKDNEVVEKFRRDIQSEHAITLLGKKPDKRTSKLYPSYALQVTNPSFTAWLVHKGVGHDKSHKLGFPDIDEELYSYFIAGLFDGDGSISSRDGRYRVSLISTKQVLAFIQHHLYIRFGISEGALQKVSPNMDNVYKMFIYKDAMKFLDYIYEDKENKELYLTRKYKRYEKNRQAIVCRP